VAAVKQSYHALQYIKSPTKEAAQLAYTAMMKDY